MPIAAGRLLRSPLIDLLAGPHGIDGYLELIRPQLTVRDARARVLAIRHQSARSVTLTLRPNAAFGAFRAGQSIPVGVEIDGVRRTRTYSPVSSECRPGGLLELTVTAHPEGLVSRHLHTHARPGMVLHLGPAAGDFVLPRSRPKRLVLISGGSGVTPVLSMLRTLCEEGHSGKVGFLHYARSAADWLYRPEVQALAARHANVHAAYVATRGGGGHVGAEAIRTLIAGADPDRAHVAACGPPSLIQAIRAIWSHAPERVIAETFAPPAPAIPGVPAGGTVRFLRTARQAPIAAGTLLQQAEAAGLSPGFGCRMGICHTCTCRKAAGAVRNLLSGEVSAAPDEDIQLCVSVPAGDVSLEL